jgi:hypothetical protein
MNECRLIYCLADLADLADLANLANERSCIRRLSQQAPGRTTTHYGPLGPTIISPSFRKNKKSAYAYCWFV